MAQINYINNKDNQLERSRKKEKQFNKKKKNEEFITNKFNVFLLHTMYYPCSFSYLSFRDAAQNSVIH